MKQNTHNGTYITIQIHKHNNKNTYFTKLCVLYVGGYTKFQQNRSDNTERNSINSFTPFSKVCH